MLFGKLRIRFYCYILTVQIYDVIVVYMIKLLSKFLYFIFIEMIKKF